MRYLIAMATAILCAALATMFVSSPVAGWVVRQYTFDSPDTVAALHAATFMVCNVTALVFGFLIGWMLGSRWQQA
jgi:ABC-type sulfate transport system permease component